MYETYFSLSEAPFDGLPDERFYFVGSAQKQALSLLKDQLSRQGAMCVLQGPSGCGKTTLVRMLIRTLPERMRIIAIDDPRLNPHLLLATVLRACGVAATSLESVAELTFRLRQMLDNSSRSDELITVIIDEAQGLSDETLEQVRLMSNIEGSTGRRVNFLLVGQELLTKRIQHPSMKMFYSRVRAFATIPALKRDEVQSYISFRLQQAGCHEPLFTQKAMHEIYKGSSGLPRLINSIADESLSIACNQNKRQVTGRMVRRAVGLVRHGHAGLTVRLKRAARKIASSLIYRLPFLALGALISCMAFAAVFFLFPRDLSNEEISAALNGKSAVKAAADGYFRARSYALSSKGRESGIFFAYRSQAFFKSDAISSLIGMWGYKRQDATPTQCGDLKKTSLECSEHAGSLSEVLKSDRPAVLQMRDENLTPYYAVLVKARKDSLRLLLGDRLFYVKPEFVKQEYDGAYTLVMPRHRAFALTVPSYQKAKRGSALNALECALKIERGAIDSQSMYSKAVMAFNFRYPSVLSRKGALDHCSSEGPRLYEHDGTLDVADDDEDELSDETSKEDEDGSDNNQNKSDGKKALNKALKDPLIADKKAPDDVKDNSDADKNTMDQDPGKNRDNGAMRNNNKKDQNDNSNSIKNPSSEDVK